MKELQLLYRNSNVFAIDVPILFEIGVNLFFKHELVAEYAGGKLIGRRLYYALNLLASAYRYRDVVGDNESSFLTHCLHL